MLKFNKNTLINFVYVVWFSVGVMLLLRIPGWYPVLSHVEFYLSALAGIVLAAIKATFVFHKTILKNRIRIQELPGEKHNILLFHSWKFYVLLIPMISGGVFLRTSEFIPKYFVLPVYLGVGLAMIYTVLKFTILRKYRISE